MLSHQNNNLINALLLLIGASLEMQDNPYINHNKGIDHLKEFCTIKIKSARRSGHTQAMLTVANNHFKNPLIIMPVLSNIINIDLKDFANLDRNRNFSSIFQLNRIKSQSQSDFDSIFIDCIANINTEEEKEIYRLAFDLSKNKDHFIVVFVG